MNYDLAVEDEVITACALCPTEHCSAVVISCQPARESNLCEFVCSRCGTEFCVPEDQLIFQSVMLDNVRNKFAA